MKHTDFLSKGLTLLFGSLALAIVITVLPSKVEAATPPSSPTWWNGTCDSGASGMSVVAPDGGTYNSIITCAPGPYYTTSETYQGPPGSHEHDVSFLDVNGSVVGGSLKVPEFDCTELAFRYVWLKYDVVPYSISGGSDFVAAFNTSTYPSFTKVSNQTTGVIPQDGDIISYGTAGDPTDPNNAGHVAIVVDNSQVVNGLGYITVLQENSGSYYTEKDYLTTQWKVEPLTGDSAKTVEGWLHPSGSGNSYVSYQRGNKDVAVDANSVVQLMNRDPAQGVVSLNWQAATGGPWHGAESIPGSLIADPIVIQGKDGGLYAFGTGGDHKIYVNYQTGAGTTWSGWTSLWSGDTGTGDGHLAVVAQPNGYLDVFIIGYNTSTHQSNNLVYHAYQSGTSTWSGSWQPLWSGDTGTLTSIAAVQNGVNAEQVIAVGTGSSPNIYTAYENTPGSETSWNGSWQMIGSSTNTVVQGSTPVVVNQANGLLDVFATYNGGLLYHDYQTSSSAWSGWNAVGISGTSFTGIPSVAMQSNGEFVAVERGTDNKVYWTTQSSPGSNASWGTWGQILNLPIQSDPVLISAPGNILTFYATDAGGLTFYDPQSAVGTWQGWLPVAIHSGNAFVGQTDDGWNIDNVVFTRNLSTNLISYKYQSGNPQSWSSWNTISSTLTFAGNASVAVDQNGALEAFARGTDNKVYRTYQATPGNNSTWTSWAQLGGSSDTVSGNPVAVTEPNGLLDVFVQYNNGHPYHDYQTNSTTWSGWTDMTGTMIGDPAIAQNASGGESVVIIGQSPYNIWTTSETTPGDPTSYSTTWTQIGSGGTAQGSPSAITQSNGLLDVYINGGNVLYHNYQTSSGWQSSWSGISTTTSISGDPHVIAEQSGTYQVFVLSQTGNEVMETHQSTPGASTNWTGLNQVSSGTGSQDPVGIYMPAPGAALYVQATDTNGTMDQSSEDSSGNFSSWGAL